MDRIVVVATAQENFVRLHQKIGAVLQLQLVEMQLVIMYLFNPQLDTVQVRKHKTVKHTTASMPTVRQQGRALTN